MSNEEAVTLNTEAIVEVRLTLRIPNDAAFYGHHEVDSNDSEQIEEVVMAELHSWADSVGVSATVDEIWVGVLPTQEQKPDA